MNRRGNTTRLRAFLKDKVKSTDERHFNRRKDTVLTTHKPSKDKREGWGGTSPSITLEYDERNGFLFSANIRYNRRAAEKGASLTGDQLRQKLDLEFETLFHIEKDVNSGTSFYCKGIERSRKYM